MAVPSANHDDAQLMSYAAQMPGAIRMGSDALAERARHAIISHGEVTGAAQGQLTFDQVRSTVRRILGRDAD